MKKLLIEINSLNFTIKILDSSMYPIIKQVCSRLTSHTLVFDKRTKRYYKDEDKSFYTFDPNERIYRFPITILRDLLGTLGSNKISKDDIEFINNTAASYGAHVIKTTPNNKYVLRDYQEECLRLLNDNYKKKILLVDLHTGGGKGLILSRFIGDHKTRAMFLLLPKYIEKWKKDLHEYLNIEEDEIYVIQGDESLINLMEEQDLEYKVIIFSLTSLTYYLKNYELKTVEYPVAPQNLMQHLNIGLLVNDETHQHFHAIMRAVSYFNTSFMVCSSATLDSNNTTMKNLYKLLVPYGNRISNLTEYKPYTDMYVVTYNMIITKAIKYKRAKGYNHILYEQSLLNNSYLLNKYYEMIYFYLDKYYFKKRQPEDKLAIFFASIDMCNSFTNYMKEKHPDESIYRYIGGDDYGTMLNSNIIITNQGMLGTGIDIKNLTMVFQTVSMGSLQANLQNFGRLRKIEGKDTSYFYIYCRDIQNHRKLSKERFEALKDRCKSIYYLQYHTELRS